jgi:hypothetical protein
MEDVQNYQQAELQWLQDQSQINGDKLDNVRCEGQAFQEQRERTHELATYKTNMNVLRLE